MSPTVTPPKPAEVLADLVQVSQQVEAGKETDKETVAKARACEKFSDFVKENVELLESLGAVQTIKVADTVASWVPMLAPHADLNWDKAEVAQKLNYLDAIQPFGALTSEQEETLESVREVLKSASRGGTGIRAPRTPQERIEGRPLRVITKLGQDAKSNQAGNLPNSVSNIKNAAVKLLNSALEKDGKQLTEEHAEQISDAIKLVVIDGSGTASVLGLTFEAADE